MFIDSCDLPSETVIEADICIVGTGPAGAAIVRELASANVRAVILESGDLTPEVPSGSTPRNNDEYTEVTLRARQFGGTSNMWAIKIGAAKTHCRFTPFDEIDFEQRDWLPYSGWPIDRDTLDPFYRRACGACGLGPYAFDGTTWERPDGPQLSFPGGRLVTTMFQFGPRESHTETCRDVVNKSKELNCYLNATVVQLDTDDTARAVERVEVVTPKGNRFWVKAGTFVLATGGIENTRLLLMSNRTVPQGLGNRNDLVGRFFMDHYMVHSGYLFVDDRKSFNQAALYDLRVVDGTVVQGKLSLTKEAMRSERLLNSATYLLPRYRTAHLRAWGIESYQALRQSLRARRMPKNAPRHLLNLAKLPMHVGFAVYRRMIRKRPQHPWIAQGGWSDLPDKHKEFASFEIQHLIEQAPHPENRITLGDDRDRFGCREPKIDSILREPDLRTIKRVQEILGDEFRRSGLGRLILTPEPFPRISSPHGSGHHMGTTRMHVDPKQGVVDVDCKVHDVANLYIAGSSVFPTGSYANPTLTIVAMAIRLADHLKSAHGRLTAVSSGVSPNQH